MISKLSGALKGACYKLRRGRALHFGGIPSMDRNTRINLKKGNLSIGRGFRMKPGAYIAVVNGGNLAVGDHVAINRNSMIICHESITIGDNCFFGPNVMIYDHDHKFGYDGIVPGYRTSPVTIGKNCWLGAGVVVLRGTRIGEGCVIGAGCVVKGDIPPHSQVTANRHLTVTPLALPERKA